MPVNTPHSEYEAKKVQWGRMRDCYEGRDRIIAAGEQYLPKLPGNPESDYYKRGNFYNAVRRTIQGLAGAVMQKEPQFLLPSNVPEDILTDLTLGDVMASTLILYTLQEVLLVGRHGLLVDMSTNPNIQPRPYVVRYKAEDIISWRVARIGGDDQLVRVVLQEFKEEPDKNDEFVMKVDKQYRVLELTEGEGYKQSIWTQQADSQKFVKSDEIIPLRLAETLDFIPFTFVGPTSSNASPERPPLLDLADVNLAHWRNSADHEYGMHLVALPTPWVRGHKGESGDKLKIGPTVVWLLGENGEAGMLEFTGKGLDSIDKAMDKKEKLMAILGARLLEEQATTQETATAVGMRHSGEHATLRTAAISVEQRLSRVLRIIAWWLGTDKTVEDVQDTAVVLNKEFFARKLTAQELQALVFALQSEAISYDTFYHNLKEGQLTRPDITPEEERLAISAGAVAQPEEE